MCESSMLHGSEIWPIRMENEVAIQHMLVSPGQRAVKRVLLLLVN